MNPKFDNPIIVREPVFSTGFSVAQFRSRLLEAIEHDRLMYHQLCDNKYAFNFPTRDALSQATDGGRLNDW